MAWHTRCAKGVLAGFACAALLAATPALADRPSWAGEGKPDKHGGKHEHKERHKDREKHREGSPRSRGSAVYFGDHHRLVMRDYYAGEFRTGHCPPGLAKKRNGCMPPGLAKKWRIGRPLPPEVVYFDLPPVIVTSLGPPPPGHRYVRVAGDVLLIAIGSALVIDAIQDLGSM